MGRRTKTCRAQFTQGRKRAQLLFLLLCTALIFVACKKGGTTQVEAASENSVLTAAGDEDLKAGGTAVILQVDENRQKIIFEAIDTSEQYELSYDGKTLMFDEYGAAQVPAELRVGDIVDIVVSIHSGVLTEVNGTKGTFCVQDLTDYEINLNRGVFSTDGKNYRITDKTVVVENGVPGKFADIKKGDRLTIRGIDHDIYSIIENGGVGYVRIRGAESFQGGWIELGEKILPVENNMLVEVPEGSYEMMVSYHKYGGTKSVNVERGKEVSVDVSDLKGELLKYGKITFTFTPQGVSPIVRIDGEKVSTAIPVELEYGIHSLDIFADGYVTIRKYISVGSPMANLDVQLEEVKESEAASEEAESTKEAHEAKPDSTILPDKFTKDDEKEEEEKKEEEKKKEEKTETGNSNTGNTQTGNTNTPVNTPEDPTSVSSTTNQLYIDSPEGVEVYFDGSYKGIAPCHFVKSAGTHVVTLMKNGYVTKNYTITLSATTDNESYSFNELKKEKKKDDDVQTVSD